MAIPKVSLFVPLGQGALDTKKAPLSMPVTSLLQADNVVQERRGEYRRRNGFTQSIADSPTTVMGIPFAVASNGTTGMVATDYASNALYNPVASTPWASGALQFDAGGCDDVVRYPLGRTASSELLSGFASDGTWAIFVRQGVTNPNFPTPTQVTVSLINLTSGVVTDKGLVVADIRARCASMAGWQVAFLADNAGNLYAVRANLTTGVLNNVALIHTGVALGGTAYLDAMYYTGSTITVVVNMAAGGFQFIEYNPSTGALATDVNIAGAYQCLSLIAEPSGSGTRIVGTSTAAATAIKRMTSAGVVSSTDNAEAVSSTQITGCATAAGVDWAVIYQTAAGLRYNNKTAGVVGSPLNANNLVNVSTNGINLDGQGFGESGDLAWYCLFGSHSTAFGDEQHTTTLVKCSFGVNNDYCPPMAPFAPLQTVISTVAASSLRQVTRVGTRKFGIGMAVLNDLTSPSAGTSVSVSEMTMFLVSLLKSTDLLTVSKGAAAPRGGHPLIPLNLIRQVVGQALVNVGTIAPPRALTFVSQSNSGGAGLTLLTTYQHCTVIETENQEGQKWRSQPSTPVTTTLTGANNQIALTFKPWQSENLTQNTRLKVYRTDAVGSVFRLISVQQFSYLNGDIAFTDSATDASIQASEILYTTGEAPNMCWPPSSHVWMFDDRLWAVNRDFRTEIQYSKNLQANLQPETTLAHVIDLDDQWGGVTNGSSVEGRGVVFKRNAIYFLRGDGLTNAATGNNYIADRANDDVGSLPGSPLVNAGDTIYFVSQRGIYSVDAQGRIVYVGGGIDAWFNQPQVNTAELVYDGVFVPLRNEVRFCTTNYIFVYDRNFPDANGLGQWTRWTLPFLPRRCLMVNDVFTVFDSTGQVWKEGTTAQTTDQGNAFTGVVRTPWIRYQATGALPPAPTQAPLRLYDGRAVLTRTAGGGSIVATAKVYINDDESQVQTFTSGSIAGATLTDVGEFFPTQQKCTSFSLEIDLPSGDNTLRIEGFAANVGIRVPSEQRRPSGGKWT